ncbi:hypothetical protein L1987_32446 [Smallanthus sonchifolius]|uniref:Uncharacterized protein n=1 Tax=Smallanthus sonchifolius TaxID=185202 RepID=A0ACB9HNJ6_9ASTR|nr:hypothetical protein L1987_32446 [Smallanthus sonchifolius]
MRVVSCSHVEEVLEVEGMEGINSESQTLVQIPNLTQMELKHLYKLKHIWKSSHHHLRTVLEFPNLTTLSIQRCNSLKHVFTSSMVGSLQQLQDLHISWCPDMETKSAIDIPLLHIKGRTTVKELGRECIGDQSTSYLGISGSILLGNLLQLLHYCNDGYGALTSSEGISHRCIIYSPSFGLLGMILLLSIDSSSFENSYKANVGANFIFSSSRHKDHEKDQILQSRGGRLGDKIPVALDSPNQVNGGNSVDRHWVEGISSGGDDDLQSSWLPNSTVSSSISSPSSSSRPSSDPSVSSDHLFGRGPCLSGTPCEMNITSDGTGSHHGWYCNYIEVTTTGAHIPCAQQTFTVEQWLATDASPYELTAIRDYCGSDGVSRNRRHIIHESVSSSVSTV